jgi:FkbH-like protein
MGVDMAIRSEVDYLRYQAQEFLFSALPSRLALHRLNMEAGVRCIATKVNVWRNHSFEPFSVLARPYHAYGHCSVEYHIGDYDDALLFGGYQPADVELLWLDSSRYLKSIAFEDWLEWLISRIWLLRSFGNVPIIVATWLETGLQAVRLQARLDTIPAVFFADIRAVCSEAHVKLLDERTAMMAGTSLSKSAQILIARKLACHWLPGTVLAPIKVVALDLDNTLHAGILGEDGNQGVVLTPGHQSLQISMKLLKQRGVFLALISRNEREDVEALFSARKDYPLNWNDFSAIEVSWGSKADALTNIAKTLHVSPNSILFVDDNPGELAEVVTQLQEIHTVLASDDAMLTQRVIEFYPGLWRWKTEADDVKRIHDMMANSERERLLKERPDPSEYFRGLETVLVFRLDPLDQLGRLADLCNKTNQFNLALRRFNQIDLAGRMERTESSIVSVHLRDRLSDSGVIALIVASRKDDKLLIEELCISCRAMGRRLENSVILEALRGMPALRGCTEIMFCVQKGPRNRPAIEWLEQLLGNGVKVAEGIYSLPVERLQEFILPDGITSMWE